MKPESPPRKRGGQGYTDWAAYIDVMKANPGVWYNVGDFSPGIPHALRMGKYRVFLDKASAMPPDTQMRSMWEITARNVDGIPRRVAVFMRWIGG